MPVSAPGRDTGPVIAPKTPSERRGFRQRPLAFQVLLPMAMAAYVACLCLPPYSLDAQGIYAQANNEYPISPEVAPSAVVQSWGKLKADKLPLEEIANLRKKASELVDKVNFDAGPSS